MALVQNDRLVSMQTFCLSILSITWSQSMRACTCQETVGNPCFTPNVDLSQCETCPRWSCFCCTWVEMCCSNFVLVRVEVVEIPPAHELYRPVWWAQVISVLIKNVDTTKVTFYGTRENFVSVFLHLFLTSSALLPFKLIMFFLSSKENS